MNRKVMLMIWAVSLAIANTAAAHHSFAWFDRSKTISLQGTVRTLQWTNPHVWLWIEVPDEKGNSTSWGLEAPSPVNLERLGTNGWNKNIVKTGDKVMVDAHPARSGQPGGELVKLVLENGQVMLTTPDSALLTNKPPAE